MKLNAEQYAQALWEAVSQTAEKDHGLIVERFLHVLKQNGDINIWDKIENHFHELTLRQKGIHTAKLITAREMDLHKNDLDILNLLAGKKLEIKKHINEDLVGGVVMQVDDMLIDASIKSQIDKLSEELKN